MGILLYSDYWYFLVNYTIIINYIMNSTIIQLCWLVISLVFAALDVQHGTSDWPGCPWKVAVLVECSRTKGGSIQKAVISWDPVGFSPYPSGFWDIIPEFSDLFRQTHELWYFAQYPLKLISWVMGSPLSRESHGHQQRIVSCNYGMHV